jgi:hypothetical protein
MENSAASAQTPAAGSLNIRPYGRRKGVSKFKMVSFEPGEQRAQACDEVGDYMGYQCRTNEIKCFFALTPMPIPR